jgi:5-carboxymethyl-2-hydroxymuconate isomerase
MPHCIIEYSHGLFDESDLEQVMQDVKEEMLSVNLFAADAIKIRAIQYKDFLIDSKYQNFIHIDLRILTGRTTEQKEGLARAVQDCLKSKFLDENISVTTEITEMNKDYYQK